jgi:hypothetical protein
MPDANILLDSASKSHKYIYMLCKYCIFSKSAIFIFIRTQAFEAHTKYYVTPLMSRPWFSLIIGGQDHPIISSLDSLRRSYQRKVSDSRYAG